MKKGIYGRSPLWAIALCAAACHSAPPETASGASQTPCEKAPAPAEPPQPDPLGHYTALAELPFETGYPTPEGTAALDRELYFQRAVQAYLWALPAVNMYASCNRKRWPSTSARPA